MAKSDKRYEMRFLDREAPRSDELQELDKDPIWVAAFDDLRIYELGKRLAEELGIEDRHAVTGLVMDMLNVWFGATVLGNRPYEPDSLDEVALGKNDLVALCLGVFMHQKIDDIASRSGNMSSGE